MFLTFMTLVESLFIDTLVCVGVGMVIGWRMHGKWVNRRYDLVRRHPHVSRSRLRLLAFRRQ